MLFTLPILVMTRNDGFLLKQCIESMVNTVTIDTTIYIIDNNSDSVEQHSVLNDLALKYSNVKLVFNKSNLWVIGLNATIKKIKLEHKSNFFFLTDADIDFSHCAAKPCWLSYLVEQLEKNISIGKLGLSLSWDYLEKNLELKEILKQEKSLYSERHKINDLYVSFVDTTATLFRNDWSIDPSSGLYPDHMRYLRPELYSCRTSRYITVEHLGWHLYINTEKMTTHHINSKIKCFTLVGGDVKKEILKLGDKRYQFFYKTFSKTLKRMWFIRRYYFLLRYIFRKGIVHFDGQGYVAKYARDTSDIGVE
ncbi:TPA: glycosyltransferase family 2 protein [Aeromonas salmonicida]|uniref:glycosyltransferase family A protein n=2 Tax=Aeromonas salmonicida TaxID=645 RepID=UPI0022405EB3|nr:glycosyltransferase family A protein [Aeromonas salmonicida]HDN9014685.1 glycosyltransferase family 2 protein [Aeromonas salmonicida]